MDIKDIYEQFKAKGVEEEFLGSDFVVFLVLLLDNSSSMTRVQSAVLKCLKIINDELSGLEEAGNILLHRIDFNCSCDIYDSDIRGLQHFDTTHYAPNGGTAIKDSIIKFKRKYLDDSNSKFNLFKNNNYELRCAFDILSDGDDEHSTSSVQEAREAIEAIKEAGFLVQFFDFGEENKGLAKQLGIEEYRGVALKRDRQGNAIIDEEAIRSFIDIAVEISKSMSQVSRGQLPNSGLFY